MDGAGFAVATAGVLLAFVFLVSAGARFAVGAGWSGSLPVRPLDLPSTSLPLSLLLSQGLIPSRASFRASGSLQIPILRPRFFPPLPLPLVRGTLAGSLCVSGIPAEAIVRGPLAVPLNSSPLVLA